MSYDFKLIGRTVNQFFWTLILQGVVSVLLGILILIYPALLIALASVFFLVIGISTFVLAGKIRRIWHMLPKMMQ
jgi:uncharacterized membrane protein HdeD (DUF308 family)